MSLLFALLLWVLIVLGALLLLLLLVPLDLRARGRLTDETADGLVRVRWGGGLLAIHISPAGAHLRLLGLRIARLRGGSSRPRRSDPDDPAPDPEPTRKRRGARWFWRHRATLLHAARRLLRTLHLRGAVSGRIGLGDPVDNAALHALLAVAEARSRRLELDVRCDWLDDGVELDGNLRALVWPVEVLLVGLTVRFGRRMRAALRATA